MICERKDFSLPRPHRGGIMFITKILKGEIDMMFENLEADYNNMVKSGKFSDASSIAFKIAELMTKEESGWCGCAKPDCQKWMDLGYENAKKAKYAH